MNPSAGIYARRHPYLDRYVQVGVVGNRLISVEFPSERPSGVDGDHPILETIERYLDGGGDDLSTIDVALTVDARPRAVLETVREIPYGTERSVSTIAALAPGVEPSDVGVVERALRENPIPLVIPDHRVTDGPSGAPRDVVRRLRALEGLE